MLVSGVRPSEKIYAYNSIRLNVFCQPVAEADEVASKVDVKKIVSDMTQDAALQKYQYFVRSKDQGNAKNGFYTGERFAL